MLLFTFHCVHTSFMLNKQNILLTWQLLTVELAAVLTCYHQEAAHAWIYVTCKGVWLITGDLSENNHFIEEGDSFQIHNSSHQSSAVCKCSVHMAPICTTSAIPTPPTCVNNPPNIFTDECQGKQLRKHKDESQPGEKTEGKLQSQRWNVTGTDKWRRDGEREADGEVDWWDQLSDKLVMNASAGSRKQESYESGLEEEWMKRPRKTVWWRKLELMESHCRKPS